MNPRLRKTNFTNEDINPCIEESKLSRQCLEENAYLYHKCSTFFDNFNNCKKFWADVCAARRRAGIKPIMPTKDERQKIMEQKKKKIIK